MAARLGFVDLLQGPEYYSTRTITDSTATGSAVGTLPASNLFNRNLGKPWKRTGLASGDTCRLDLDLVRVRPDGQAESGSPQCAGIGMVVIAGVTAITSGGRYPYQIDASFHATTNAFADGGGTNPYASLNWPLSTVSPGAIKSTAICPADSYNVSAGGVPYDYGSSGQKIGRYIRIMLIPFFAGGGTCDLSVGRIMVMQTLQGVNELSTYSESAESNAEVVTAFDGTPYTLPRQTSRRVAFSLGGMAGALVKLNASNAFSASMLAANRHMGTTNDAVLVTDEANGLTTRSVCIVGRLASPLTAKQLTGGGSTLLADINSISGDIIETPF